MKNYKGHVAPMRCKILWALGFTSSSRIFARCELGVKPYKGCERCENNVAEQYIEAIQRGMSDGLKERKELLLRLDGGRRILIDCEHIEHCGTPLYVGECNPECLRRRDAEFGIKKGDAE